MGVISLIAALFKAFGAGLNVFKQERQLKNSPEVVKGALSVQLQQAKDKINAADAVLADPNATPEQHAAALREIRLAHS